MTLRQLITITVLCAIAYLVSCAAIGTAKLFLDWLGRIYVSFEWGRFFTRAWHFGRMVFAIELCIAAYVVQPNIGVIRLVLHIVSTLYCLLILKELTGANNDFDLWK